MECLPRAKAEGVFKDPDNDPELLTSPSTKLRPCVGSWGNDIKIKVFELVQEHPGSSSHVAGLTAIPKMQIRVPDTELLRDEKSCHLGGDLKQAEMTALKPQPSSRGDLLSQHRRKWLL